MSEKNGGPAFPHHATWIDVAMDRGERVRWDGMSLRDHFAAKAMQALIAKAPFVGNDLSEQAALNIPIVSDEQLLTLREGISHGAYLYADAMLAERDE